MNAKRQRLVQALQSVLPATNVLWQKEDTAPYECDGLAAYRTLPLAVALPEDETQVQAVLKICRENAV
ncbi:MAG: FAD-binding oxidoreductase, partial [Rhodocyclales bacterium]|nr:FAD-binding oxidoreductase [Rhodocyclales bacterium]